MHKRILFLLLGLFSGTWSMAQTVIRLYDGKAPGSEQWTGDEVTRRDSVSENRIVSGVVTPSITIFLPDSSVATGTSVLILPGGNLQHLLVDEEGTAIAKRLTAKGIAAFVLNYRLAQPANPKQPQQAQRVGLSSADSAHVLSVAIADCQAAIDYLRQRPAATGIQSTYIGLVGFSTGGTIAVKLAYQPASAHRPDFVIPVQAPIEALTSLNVPDNAPPLFIVSAIGKSNQAAIQNAGLYQKWIRAGWSAELHSYATGGIDTGQTTTGIPADKWFDPLTDWLTVNGYMTKRAGVWKTSTLAGKQLSAANLPLASGSSAIDQLQQKNQPRPAPEPITSRQTGSRIRTASGLSTGWRVSGTVRDSASGKPLVDVAIVIDYRKHLTGTTTDAQGNYTIDLPAGQHILVARLVGYTPARKEILVAAGPLTVDVNMVSVESQLEEVVVTTKGFDQTLRQPILGANQLNVTILKKMPSALGEVDLLRGLQMLPGVSSVGEAANGVNIRGGTTDQNLILLDDTPIFNPTHMFGLFSVFPPDALNTVDLYKGNVPARFGGRAASVLDVSLRNPSLEQFSLSGGVSVVSNKLTADIPIVKGKFGILVSGRGAFNDFLLPIVSDRLANIRARFGDGVLKAFWRIDNQNTLTVTGYASLDVFRTDLLANLPNVNGTATRYNHRTINLMGRWFRTISPRLNLQTTAVYGYYVPEILSPELSGNLVTLRSSVLQRQVKSNVNYQLTNQKIEVGISGTHYRVEPGTLLPGQSDQVNYVTTPTENALELALYADYERSIGPRLAVSAGLRYSQFLALGPSLVRQYAPGEPRDDFSVIDSVRYRAGQISKSYGGPEPRLGIRYTLGPNSSVKFGYNLMRQYLQVVTNTATPLPTSRWKTADPNIRPQISQLVTAGYFRSFKENIYEFTLEGYYRSTQHIIDYRPGADFLLQPYPETQLLQGRSQSYGVESMISKKKGELTGWINYTYARTLNQVNEGPTVEQNVNSGNWYRANYDRPHSVNANLTIDVDRHNSFGFTFAYSTGRPYSAPTGFVTIDGTQYPYYGVRNNERLPDYHRLDFTWNIYNPGMRAKRWEGRWAFTVYNLYGRKNAYSIFFKAENGKTNAYQLQIFAAPIASLSYNFVFK